MKRYAERRYVFAENAFPVLIRVCTLAFGAATALAHAQSTTTPGYAAAVVVYPGKGQSNQQQDMDKYQCYDWARSQSGFDPAKATQAAPAASPVQHKGPGGAMVKGAAGGAVVARIAHGEAGRGAAAGAMSAAMRGRAQEQQMAQAGQQQVAQQQAVHGQQRATYERAFGACMEGRGYTVR